MKKKENVVYMNGYAEVTVNDESTVKTVVTNQPDFVTITY